MAPPSKKTPERINQILSGIAKGFGRNGSSKLAGIHHATLEEWMDDDPELREQILAIEAEAEKQAIQKAVKDDYTEQARDRIDRALRSGNTRWTACRAAGITLSVFKIWMELYPEFSALVNEAEAWIESVHVNNVLKAGSTGSWQASAWYLERRIPEHWGRVDRVELEIRRDQAEQAARELRSEGIYVTADELLKESDEIAKKALPVPGSSRAKKSA